MDGILELGPRLRRQRERAGFSLSRLADATGLSRTYLLRLEKEDDANPSLEVLRRIADSLDTTVADLVGSPRIGFHAVEADVRPSLRAFADEARITERELLMLASIRWRKGEEPRTAERWRYILDSLRASRSLDDPQ